MLYAYLSGTNLILDSIDPLKVLNRIIQNKMVNNMQKKIKWVFFKLVLYKVLTLMKHFNK
jgi:hypothetical protein